MSSSPVLPAATLPQDNYLQLPGAVRMQAQTGACITGACCSPLKDITQPQLKSLKSLNDGSENASFASLCIAAQTTEATSTHVSHAKQTYSALHMTALIHGPACVQGLSIELTLTSPRTTATESHTENLQKHATPRVLLSML